MFYTYILLSDKDGKMYTGSTKNLRSRFEQHTKGEIESTKYRRPFKLIYYEACLKEEDARRREKVLKSYRGKMFIKNRLKSYFTGLTKGLLFLLLIFYAHNVNAVAPATGLVAHYDFEEQSGAVANDMSGNGNNGTINPVIYQRSWSAFGGILQGEWGNLGGLPRTEWYGGGESGGWDASV